MSNATSTRRGTCALAVCALFLGGVRAHAEPNPLAVVRQSVQKEVRASYVGQQETTIIGPRGGTQRTVQDVKHKAPNKHRIEYRQPPRLAGNVDLDDGQTTWRYLRAQNVVERDETASPAAQKLLKTLARAVFNGKTRLEYLGEQTVADRKAVGVALTRLAPPGGHREIWFDQEYGVVLRAKDTGPAGRVSDVVFRSIQFDVALSDTDFEWSPPPGVIVVERGDGLPIPLVRARQIARQNWGRLLQPGYLPAAFAFQSAHLLRFAGRPVIHLRFSDGVSSFSLFEGLVEGPAQGFLRGSGPASRQNNLLPFTRGRANLLIVGALPLGELQKIADSVP